MSSLDIVVAEEKPKEYVIHILAKAETSDIIGLRESLAVALENENLTFRFTSVEPLT
ncbi:MAG: hypothetical protein MJ053_07175 [Elusimicrobiaceae bacterium]|nr:hypothetical protein [Elusimicrobiaceae bacterium]